MTHAIMIRINNSLRAFRPAFVLAVAAFAAGVASAQDDKVVKRDQTELVGRVEEYDFRGVKVKLKAGALTAVKTEEILEVSFKGLPKEFTDGQNDLTSKPDAAIAKFQAVLDNKQTRRPVRQEAFYLMAQAQFGAGQPAEGVKTLKAMLAEAEFPQSRYIAASHAQIIGASPPAEALPFVDAELARVSKIADSAPLVDQLNLARCRILLGKGDLEAAKSTATALANGTSGSAGEAKVILGDVAMAEKKPADADRMYREALRRKDLGRGARASCHNGIGVVLYDKGKQGSKKDDIREALLSFLRTVTQFAPTEPGENTVPYETALFNAGVCFQSLAELEQAGDAAQLLKARAAGLYDKLVKDYPQSQYKSDAERLRAKL
jgi:hypothetical protein